MTFIPRLLSAKQAAVYLATSETTLWASPIPRRKHGKRTVWDRYDLDAYADSLPYEGEQAEDQAKEEANAAFG